MKNKINYILLVLFITFGVYIGIYGIISAAPIYNFLGNYAIVGQNTTSTNNFVASGTIAFVSLGSSGNPCLTIGTDGTLATSTCGGGTVYISSSTPFTAGYIPFATSSASITNSNIFQSGSNIGIGTTTPSFLLEILGDLKINTSSTLGNIISGVWQGTAIGDSYISSAASWNAKQNNISFPIPVASSSLTAGRSLTLNTNDLVADVELYTDDISINVINATTTINAQKLFFNPITITQIACSTNGANITIGSDERASSTPNSAGTDVFNGGSLVCTSTGAATTTFANATIAGNALLHFDIDAAANSTTTLRVYTNYTQDD